MRNENETGSIAAIFIVLAGIVVAITCTGCSQGGASTGGHTYSSQDWVMGGTEKGAHAIAEMFVGMAKTAKESADVPNQYLEFRQQVEQEVTKRASMPKQGLWQKLTGQGTEK